MAARALVVAREDLVTAEVDVAKEATMVEMVVAKAALVVKAAQVATVVAHPGWVGVVAREAEVVGQAMRADLGLSATDHQSQALK